MGKKPLTAEQKREKKCKFKFKYARRSPKGIRERQLYFLQGLREHGRQTQAAKDIGMSTSNIYQWRDKYPNFDREVEEARKEAVRALEDEAYRRAFEGTIKPGKFGSVREFSDTLMIFLLKANDPEKYSERIRNEISGPGGVPLNLTDNQVANKLEHILNEALKRKAEAEGLPKPAIDVEFTEVEAEFDGEDDDLADLGDDDDVIEHEPQSEQTEDDDFDDFLY